MKSRVKWFNNERGFGFLECDKDSFFITPNDMKNVMHGDKISAVIETDSEKKSKAIPEKLIEPFLSRFVGTVLFVGGKLNVLVDHPSIKNKLFADDKRTEDKSKLSNGDYVICILTNHPLKSKGSFKAEIIERIYSICIFKCGTQQSFCIKGTIFCSG